MGLAETARSVPGADRGAPAGAASPFRLTPRIAMLAVGGLVLVGLALRLLKLGDSVYADELSTLYIVRDRSLGDALSLVSSDAEVSPPLSFMASWAFAKLGSAPELIRLPSLIAGMLSIPLTYLVGARAVGRTAGLVAAAVVALSPFMVYFSTEARGYALAIVFLLASTLALLYAIRSPARGWWIVYAVLSALAMYSHYTAAYPLLAQLIWLLWAFPAARAPALLANLGALVLYLPWVAGALDDRASPTIRLVEAFVASDLGAKLTALQAWAFGGPFLPPSELPGTPVVVVGIVGVSIALLGAVLNGIRGSRPAAPTATRHGLALLICLGLSAPVLELLQGALGGPEVFGPRNLGTASAGMALAIGGLISAAGAMWGGLALTAVLAAFAVAAAQNVGAGAAKPDFGAAASWIDARARAGDVIIDVFDPRSTPVPLTPLDTYLDSDLETFRPSMPVGPPPFLPFTSEPPPADRLIDRALSEADGDGRVFVVGLRDRMITSGSSLTGIEIGSPGDPGSDVYELPASARTLASTELPGVYDLELFLIERPDR